MLKTEIINCPLLLFSSLIFTIHLKTSSGTLVAVSVELLLLPVVGFV